MKEKLSKIAFQINLILLALQILIIIPFWRLLPSEIPLFYSRPWGKEQLSSYTGITILIVLCLAVLLINFVIAKIAAKEESLVKQMLAVASLTFSFLILISLIQIIRLVL